MKNFIRFPCAAIVVVTLAAGCGATSAEEQRSSVLHQNKADEAARQGQYTMAGEEQKKAEAAHSSAVEKAIDEGKPIPRQTRPGDPPPPPPPPH